MAKVIQVATLDVGAGTGTIHIDAIAASRMLLTFKNVDRCRVLFHIAEHGAMTVPELVGHIRITRAHMYQHVKRLEQFGWVRSVRRGRLRAYRCASPETNSLVRVVRSLVADLEVAQALRWPDLGHEAPRESVAANDWPDE